MNLDSSLKNDLWNFSETLVEKYSIEDAFHGLEKKYPLNRHFIIYCCWLAFHEYEGLNAILIKQILARTKNWHNDVVSELLSLRDMIPRSLKYDELKDVYRIINENVLYAERIEQSLMVKYLYGMKRIEADNAQKINNALANVFKYIDTVGATVHKTDLEKVYRIVKACFDNNED